MAYVNDFILGDSKACCDVCGFHFKGSQLRKRWDGAMVCSKDYEVQHPQDNIKIRAERNNVKDARPEPEYRFLAVGEITAADL
jgi:hypothetical protein